MLTVLSVAPGKDAHAIKIEFETVDLPDGQPGNPPGDLREYRYRVSEATFANGEGFTIDFDTSLYRDLQHVSAPNLNTDWDGVILPGAPGLPILLDFAALQDNPSLNGIFDIQFVWTGSGNPGSQPFTFNHFDSAGAFQEDPGGTVPLERVPHPASLMLLGAASSLVVLQRWRPGRLATLRRRRAKHSPTSRPTLES